MIGGSIGYLISFKILKNTFIYISNTKWKKIISAIVVLLLYMAISINFKKYDIKFEEVYSCIIYGFLWAIYSRIISTEREDKQINIKKVE